MSLSFEQKQAVVTEVGEAVADAQAGILAEYRGLSVGQLTALRAAAREQGVWIRVVKNSLAKRVVADTEFACLHAYFTGPVIFCASQDAIAVARVLVDFAEDNEDLRITCGAMGGVLLDPPAIDRLAKLPGREALLARLAGVMLAPVQQIVRTLHEVPTRFVRAAAMVAEARGGADAGDAGDGEK